MSEFQKNAESEYGFRANFERFAPTAWAQFESSESPQAWARAEARRFHHEVDQRVPFLRTYYALLKFAEVQEGLQQQRGRKVQEVARREASDFEAVSKDRAEVVYDRLLKELRSTWKDSDMKDVRYFVNEYCWREHGRWWDAFQAEEDGEEGWVRQTSKILARAIGYREDFAKAAVVVWLEKSRDASPDRF